MSIKPLAWINADNTMAGIPSVLTEYGPNRRPLYAIPNTHRVVSVDALNRIMELAGVALVYQPFGTKDRQHFDALMAIIEDKP